MIAAPAGGLTEMVGQYVMEKIPGLVLTPGMFQAFMIVNDEMDFVAGVVFTNFRSTDGVPTDIEISCATETAAAWRPDVCRAIFKYVFEQVGCVRCTSITVKGNRKARSFLEGLGFQLEGNVRLGYDGRRDALIYGLLRSECRFLADDSEREVDGQEKRTGRAPATGPCGDSSGADENEHRIGDSASEPEPD
jgi:hypothetical protein